MTFDDYQLATPIPANLTGMDAATRLAVALHGLSAAWGDMADHVESKWLNEPIFDREYFSLAVRDVLEAVATLCNVTGTNFSMAATGHPDTPFNLFQYAPAVVWETNQVNVLPLAMTRMARQLGQAHGLLRDHLVYQNGLDYHALTPLIRDTMVALRTVCNVLRVDMAGCVGVGVNGAAVK